MISRKKLLRGFGWGALVGLLLFAVAWVCFPFPKEELALYPSATILLDGTGNPLRMQLGPHDTDCRLRYHPNVTNDWIGKAVVAAEDQRFWSHCGVDPLALTRAIGQNIWGHRVVSGASTLSTQVIRLMHPRRRTLLAKGIEVFRALQLETVLDKRLILEQYLNRAPFGANLVGIEAASRRYLGKEPGDLSLAEAALLAGMPQSPSRLRPDRFPARARKRQQYVLDRMLALGMITAMQRTDALGQPIVLRKDAYPFRAPHFCDLLLDEWQTSTGTHFRTPVVQTTLDPVLQRMAEEALRRHSELLRRENVFGGAIVILDVKTGAVRALVGSPDYRDLAHAGQVNGAASPRSAGSTLKSFAYAMALDQGRITPAAMLADVPRTFKDYTPVNFDGTFSGPVTTRTALMMSLNIPALTLVEQIGEHEFLTELRKLGFGTLGKDAAHYGLGLALGNGSVRLIDLANAYACLARGGEWLPYRLREEDRGKGALECRPGLSPRRCDAPTTEGRPTKIENEGVRMFSPEASWLIADMLSGDERAANTTGHRADVRLPRVAWKTGTSSGFRDAWVVGFNPDYVVAVWLGNPDGRPSPALVGARSAVPVMWDLIRQMYPANDAPWFAMPPGIKKRQVCAVSGEPVGSYCSATVDDWAIAGVSLAKPCDVHRLRQVKDAVTGEFHAQVVEEWPAEIRSFLQKRAPATVGPGSVPGVVHADRRGSAYNAQQSAAQYVNESDAVRLVSPVAGSEYRKLDGMAEQRVPFKAECRGGGTLYWFVDNQFVAQGAGSDPLSWSLVRGKHTVVCCAASGRSAKAEIMVE